MTGETSEAEDTSERAKSLFGWQYKTVSRICDCIPAFDIVKFARELFQEGLISDACHQAAIAVNATPPSNKIAILVSAFLVTREFGATSMYSYWQNITANFTGFIYQDEVLQHARWLATSFFSLLPANWALTCPKR